MYNVNMKKIFIDYLRLLGSAFLLSAIGLLLILFNWARWIFLVILIGYMLIQLIKYKRRISKLQSKVYLRFPSLRQEKNDLLWSYLAHELDLDRCDVWWKQDWIHKKLVNNLTLLHIEAGLGDKNECAWLLGCGADLNAKDDNGLTPLDYAKKFNETEVIKLLEEYKQ